jgi:predicted alpha/beta-fold hydrolase
LQTARTYCACNTEDLEDVVAHLKQKLGDETPIASIGVSLGG